MPKWLPSLFLSALLLLLFITNYQPNTWLAGWDNLIPELNLSLNIQRSIFAVWQEYQGLGLVGGMGHSTDLIRQLFLLPISIFVSPQNLRYFWHFFTITSGTFGLYYLHKKFSKNLTTSLFVACLYLLNFVTIQNYFLPFEPFSTFWGFLPWAILAFLDYYPSPDRKKLVKLIFANLFLVPSFYVPTMFLVYLLVLTCLFLSVLNIKNINLKPFIVIFILNAFWLLPFLYFYKYESFNPRVGIGNLSSTQETIERNQFYANPKEFFEFKGYYYGLIQATGPVFDFWHLHLDNPGLKPFIWLLSLLFLYGFLAKLFSKKKTNLTKVSILLTFLVFQSLLFDILPFSLLNHLIRNSSLFDQVFRSPFTKFATIFSISIALNVSYATEQINKKISKITNLNNVFYSFVFLVNLIVILPVFFGGLYWKNVKNEIPSEYFDLITYFQKSHLTGRIANFPQGSFYGWTNYNFGMMGSGFIWYGLQNPILDRAFDVWNLQNENYYWQINMAINKHDPILLQNILAKYNIQYLLFDNHVTFPSEQIYQIQKNKTKDMISNLNLPLVKSFNDQLFVYSTDNITQPYLTNAKKTTQSLFHSEDLIFQEQGDYYSPSTTYPQPQNFFSMRNITTTKPNLSNFQEISSSNRTNEALTTLSKNTEESLYGVDFPGANFNTYSVLQFDAKNISGHPLRINGFDENKNYKFFTLDLDAISEWKTYYITFPPVEQNDFNSGLVVLFNSPSYNGKNTTNQIRNTRLYQSSPVSPKNTKKASVSRDYQKASGFNIFLQTINLQKNNITTSSNTLVFPQSFSPSWLAFYFTGLRPNFLTSHVLVNNWANGWLLPSNLQSCQSDCPTIYFFFWPQLLEFLGFILIPFGLFFIFRFKTDSLQ